MNKNPETVAELMAELSKLPPDMKIVGALEGIPCHLAINIEKTDEKEKNFFFNNDERIHHSVLSLEVYP